MREYSRRSDSARLSGLTGQTGQAADDRGANSLPDMIHRLHDLEKQVEQLRAKAGTNGVAVCLQYG